MEEILFSRNLIAVVVCVLFIGTLTTYYYMAESGFNPYPQPSTLAGAQICFPESQPCPGFSISNMTLREFNRTDISSQQVTFTLTPEEPNAMSEIQVYVDNVSMGTVQGPFAPGSPRPFALAVPTTIDVTPGVSYTVVVEGIFSGPSGHAPTDYWQSISVVAVAG